MTVDSSERPGIRMVCSAVITVVIIFAAVSTIPSCVPRYIDHSTALASTSIGTPDTEKTAGKPAWTPVTIARYRDPGTPDRSGGPGGYSARLIQDGDGLLRVVWTIGWRIYSDASLPSGLMESRYVGSKWSSVRELLRAHTTTMLNLIDARAAPNGGAALLWTEKHYDASGTSFSSPDLYVGDLDEMPGGTPVLDDEGLTNAWTFEDSGRHPLVLPTSTGKFHVLWLDLREWHFTLGVLGLEEPYTKPYIRAYDPLTGMLSGVERFVRGGAFNVHLITGSVQKNGVQHVAWTSGGSIYYRKFVGGKWSNNSRVVPTSPNSPWLGEFGDIDIVADSDGNVIIGAITDPSTGHGQDNALILARSGGARWQGKRWALPFARHIKCLVEEESGLIHLVFETDRSLYEWDGVMDEFERRGIIYYRSTLNHATIRDGYLSSSEVIADGVKRDQFDATISGNRLHVTWVEHEGLDILLRHASRPL